MNSERGGLRTGTVKETAAKNIDDYIAGFPSHVQKMLQRIRTTIQKEAPKAEEAIKYQMPTFVLYGNLIHFAAYKNHIGLYPAPRAIQEFKKDLSAYKGSKGAIQFQLDEPIPYALITRIVRFRVKESLAKAAAKGKKK